MDLISEIIENPNKLSNNFDSEESTSSSSSSNIISIKCTKALFSKDGLVSNISSYVISASMIYFLLSILLFLKCGYPLLIKQMKEIVQSKKPGKNKNQITNKKNLTQRNHSKTKKDKKKLNAPPKKLNNKKGKSLDLSNNIDSKSKFIFNNINNNNFDNIFPVYHINNNFLQRNNENNNTVFQRRKTQLASNGNKNNFLLPKKVAKIPTIKIKNNNENKIKETQLPTNGNTIKKKPEKKNIEDYNHFELNTMDYISAINYDNRTCCQYYGALIRIKHPLLFGLCPIKDYNSMIIKLCIFLLSFDIYYVINFIFFDENAIHVLYENGGKFDIIYFLPSIAISFGVANIITILIKYIFLTERNIVQVRYQVTYSAADRVLENVRRNIVIKHVIFYILGIIFLFFFWMLLSSFGAVYQNSQMILFECVLISFGISFVYPFFYNVIPCIFRFCSLSSKKRDMNCIYNFSKFLQLL